MKLPIVSKKSSKKLSEINSTLMLNMRNSSSNEFTHGFHPYFAKFHPIIPRFFINNYAKSGDVILDPYCGAGTTLVESIIKNHSCYGIDANPLAVLISKVKTTPLSKEQKNLVKKLNSKIAQLCKISDGQTVFSNNTMNHDEMWYPRIPNVNKWFKKDAFNELALIINKINEIEDEEVKNFCKVAFSRIIIKVSNQSGESRYVSVSKHYKFGMAADLYQKQINFMLRKIDTISNFNGMATVILSDTRSQNIDIETNSIGLLITSPPYLNSWDYGLYHKFRYYWLGYTKDDIKKFYNVEIGSHLRSQRENNDTVLKYREDMDLCFNNFNRVMRETGATMVFVNAPSIVDKKYIDTNSIIIEIARKYNFNVEKIFTKNVFGPHIGLNASKEARNVEMTTIAAKKEAILVLRR